MKIAFTNMKISCKICALNTLLVLSASQQSQVHDYHWVEALPTSPFQKGGRLLQDASSSQ